MDPPRAWAKGGIVLSISELPNFLSAPEIHDAFFHARRSKQSVARYSELGVAGCGAEKENSSFFWERKRRRDGQAFGFDFQNSRKGGGIEGRRSRVDRFSCAAIQRTRLSLLEAGRGRDLVLAWI